MTRFERLKRGVASGTRALRDGGRRCFAGTRWRPARPEDSSHRRELFTLAWPIAAAMLGETAMGLVDTKLVGGLGPEALAGVGFGASLVFLTCALMFGLMRGVKVRTSYAVGRGQPEDGTRYALAGVWMAVGGGLVVWAATRDLSWLLRLLGADTTTIPFARDFVAARTWGAVASCVVAALVQHRQGLGDARTPMVVGLAGNAVNATLAYALIYGRFGLPRLGVRGAGYGTAATEVIEAAVLIVLLLRTPRKHAPSSGLSLTRAAREVAALGVPTGLHFWLEALAFTAFTAVLGNLGARELAAHHVALNTIRTSFLPGLAVAEAGSVLVGRALAQRRLHDADRIVRSALAMAVGFMTACGLLFAVSGTLVARAFTSDPTTVSLARRLLLVAAVFQTLDAAYMVLRSSLRAARDVRWVAVIGTTVAWSCVPGAAYVLGRQLGWGALGGWCGFVLETSIGASLLFWRWHRGSWRRAYGSPAGGSVAEVPMASAVVA